MQDHIKLGGGSKVGEGHGQNLESWQGKYTSAFYHGRAAVDCEYCGVKLVHEGYRAINAHYLS